MLRPIYTEPENCLDCYKCIRECPVKAIRMENNKASIIEDRCIYCGHCTQVCPTGAKKIRDGLTRAQLVLEKNKKVYLSLAPSYASEFANISSGKLISAISQLGFAGVSETALGAEVVSAQTEDFLDHAKKGVYISSACPVVIEYVRKYAPEHVPDITPILSPMLAHAKILKETYGEDIKIIFAGPCIGKKTEADAYSHLIDVAITFKDLRNWFDLEGISIDNDQSITEEQSFVPHSSTLGALYPIEGGMMDGFKKANKSVHYMAFSSLSTIKEVFKNLDDQRYEGVIFLELLACSGGCVNGPAKLSTISPAIKRYEVEQKADRSLPQEKFNYLDIQATYSKDTTIEEHTHSEADIKQAMASVGKLSREDELNCSSCGYDSCRDFAVAMLEGRAEENMCASYMRKIAHDKATVLLQKIPAGVLLINADLKVVDMNRYCASSMGQEIEDIYDVCPGMEGVELEKLCSFSHLFKTVLTTGEEIKERRVKEKDKTWLLSIYNIQPHQLVFGLLQDMQEPGVRKEWILEKTREVIKNHMSTVQQVACLLGENAAFTDSSLRSIIEAYNDENVDNQLKEHSDEK